MFRPVLKRLVDVHARRNVFHFKTKSFSSQGSPAATNPLKRLLKNAALATITVGGTTLTILYYLSYHMQSILYSREFLSDAEMEQYHSLELNMIGDEATLLDDKRAKYDSIVMRYRQYMEPLQMSREPRLTAEFIQARNQYSWDKAVNFGLAILFFKEHRMGAILGFLSVMLTNQEMDVLRKEYSHVVIWKDDRRNR